MHIHRTHNSGYTLLEMAIVLTIIGLIVGSVIAGKSILEGAERRSILTDVEKYISATSAFQTKYGSLPGDMYDATTVWGAAHATPATCITTNSGTVTTCDGNGNGQIGGTSFEYEMFRAWQQLSNAGFIEGKFTGVAGSGGVSHADIGVNAPENKIKGTGFTLQYIGTGSGSFYTLTDYGHVLEYGMESATGATNVAALSAEDALSIDSKADDGLPGSGTIRSYTNTARPNCASSDTAASATYQATSATIGCNLVFLTGF
jgi:prepilin-type N-terminal cleavage/methylation domain-containing protein